MSPSTLEHLRHIQDETEYLMRSAEGLAIDDFKENDTLKRAFVRSIEIIGEAAKRVAPGIREKYDQIEWKAVAGMRDKLIHGYFGVDYDIVWNVVSNKIPILHQEILKILQDNNL